MEGKAILAMVMAAGLLGGAAVAQQPPAHRKGGGPERDRGDRMTEYLGLSA